MSDRTFTILVLLTGFGFGFVAGVWFMVEQITA